MMPSSKLFISYLFLLLCGCSPAATEDMDSIEQFVADVKHTIDNRIEPVPGIKSVKPLPNMSVNPFSYIPPKLLNDWHRQDTLSREKGRGQK